MGQSFYSIVVVALAVLGSSALIVVLYLMLRVAIKPPRRYLPYSFAMAGLTFLVCFVFGVAMWFLKQPDTLILRKIGGGPNVPGHFNNRGRMVHPLMEVYHAGAHSVDGNAA